MKHSCSVVARWNLVFIVLMLAFFVSIASPVFAQNSQPCNNQMISIWNDSAQPLKVAAICETAVPWTQHGVHVYIYVTEKSSGSSSQEWLALRDKIESTWGIYDPTNDTFRKNALAIEVTLDTSKPWGQDLAYGELLFGTKLYEEKEVANIESSLKRDVAKGDVSDAIMNGLSTAYQLAFPTQILLSPAPSQSVISAATLPAQKVEVPTAITDVQVNGFSQFFTVAIALVIGGMIVAAFIHWIAIPLGVWLRRRRSLERMITSYEIIILAVVEIGKFNFPKNDVEGSSFYRAWASNGGSYANYPKEDDGLRSAIENTLYVLTTINANWQEYLKQVAEKKITLEKALESLEWIYGNIIGSEAEMTHEKLTSRLDPFGAMIFSREASEMASDTPPNKLKNDTVHGLLQLTEVAMSFIDELADAKESIDKTLESASLKRKQMQLELGNIQFADQDTLFSFTDGLIQKAEEEKLAQRWMYAQQAAQEAVACLDKLPKLATLVDQCVQDAEKFRQRVGQIAQKGFKLPEANATLRDASELQKSVTTALVSGDYPHVEEHATALVKACERASQQAQAGEQLYADNNQKLAELSKRVAEIHEYLTQHAEPALASLINSFQQADCQPVANNVKDAKRALSAYFDDPADPQNLSSTIEKLNDLNGDQQFAQAAQRLDEAFTHLHSIDQRLKAVVEHLGLLQTIAREIMNNLSTAEHELSQVKTKRDADDALIGPEVDAQIAQAEVALLSAQNSAKERSYLAAHAFLMQGRELIAAAAAAADVQVKQIATLFEQLRTGKSDAQEVVSTAAKSLNDLIPAAKTETSAKLCREAKAALQAALSAEAEVTGEDHTLARSLETAVDAFTTARQRGEQALKQIQADQEQYDSIIQETESAISAARSALNAAQSTVNQSDAQGAGSVTLGRARALLPNMTLEGQTIATLQRICSDAQTAQSTAREAESQASSRIRQVQRDRAEAARRAADEEAERRRRRERDERDRRASQSSFSSSSSRSSGSSSMGSSSRR